MKVRRHLRSEAGHQGEVFWNQSLEYDDEAARLLILKDKPKTKLIRTFEYEKNL